MRTTHGANTRYRKEDTIRYFTVAIGKIMSYLAYAI